MAKGNGLLCERCRMVLSGYANTGVKGAAWCCPDTPIMEWKVPHVRIRQYIPEKVPYGALRIRGHRRIEQCSSSPPWYIYRRMDGSMDVSCSLTFDDLMNADSSYSFAGEVFNLQDPLQNESAQNSPTESNGLLQDKFQAPAEIKTDTNTEKRSDRFNNIARKIQPVDLNSLESNRVKIVRNREKPTSLANEIDTFFKDVMSTNADQKEKSCSQKSVSPVIVDKDVQCDVVQSFDIDFDFCNLSDVNDQFGQSQTTSTTLQDLEQHVSTEMKSSNRQLKGTQHTRCMKQRRSRPDVAPYRTAQNQCLENQRLENQRLQNQRLQNQRLQNQRLQNQRLQNQRLENQRLENQRLENQRLENQRLENQRLQNQRLENQRLQNQRLQNMFWHLRKQLPVQMVSDWEIARALDS